MPEIVYQLSSMNVPHPNADIRWLSQNESQTFNTHLVLCGQRPIGDDIWDQIGKEGTVYCLLWDNGVPAARACVEKYSEEKWEVSDVRTMKDHRNKGFAYQVCLYVMQYILSQGKTPTIRTEADNYAMQRVIGKLGFTPLE